MDYEHFINEFMTAFFLESRETCKFYDSLCYSCPC